MAIRGRVLAGQYVDATITLSLKGDLGLHLGLRRLPRLTSAEVARWERIERDRQPRPGYDVLPDWVRSCALAVRDAARGQRHTVRVEWNEGEPSIIELPTRFFIHFAVLLQDREVGSAARPTSAVVTGSAPPLDPVAQIERLATLRDQGVLTEAEFVAKKTELLARV
ncbi:SHOCT domain-containing protein [Nocardioides houyundeii]|uniref:SHOCT domain-containing protein n=1 Tax=Nocardioides houyundeii TaxID=2045452 RepID=UPI0013152160|nr:SHOCT domain-containing protein [Nocardioides houyundeii]